MDVHKSSLEIVRQFNGAFSKSVKKHPKRSLFFTLISNKKTIEESVDICLTISLPIKLMNKTKLLIKRLVKFVLGDNVVIIIKKVLRK